MPEYICPYCNTTLNKITNHCGNCGGKLPADLKPVEYRCPDCGIDIDRSGRIFGPKHCENCGAELPGELRANGVYMPIHQGKSIIRKEARQRLIRQQDPSQCEQ